MDYLTYFIITVGIVTYIIASAYGLYKLIGRDPSGVWLAIHTVLLILLLVVYAIYHDFGIRGIIIPLVILAGILIPLGIFVFITCIPDMLAAWEKNHPPKTKKVKELPPQGDYIDVEYTTPIKRTVEELLVD
jgi:hypothetical protein